MPNVAVSSEYENAIAQNINDSGTL
jgi:hypothetical protein